MQSTMQDRPLTVAALLAHGRRIHAGSEVVSFEGDRTRRATFAATQPATTTTPTCRSIAGIKPSRR